MLVDTDVLIWYMRGNTKARRIIEGLDRILISVVTYMELVQGLRNKKELAALKAALRTWNAKILYIDEEISVKAMFLVEQHYLANSLMLADALIAATAFSARIKLLTGNVKHYHIVKDIEIEGFKP